MNKSIMSGVACFGVLFLIASANALDNNDAFTTSQDKLWSVNIESGGEQLIGTVQGHNFLSALTFDVTSNQLFALDSQHLIQINPTNAAATQIGSHGLSLSSFPSGLATDSMGNLFMLFGNSLYSINRTTAATTLIGSGAYHTANGLEFSPTGELYAIAEVPALNGLPGLIRLNPATGAIVSIIGALHDPLNPNQLNGGLGMDFNDRGVLYVACPGRNSLYIASLVDASLIRVGDLPISFGSLAIFRDCNENDIHDAPEIAFGMAMDVNGNGIPDECAFCGDGMCQIAEDACSCNADCGPGPATEQVGSTCTDGLDNDCDLLADCDDSDCATETICLPPPIPGGPGDLLMTSYNADRVLRIDSQTGQVIHVFTTGPTVVTPYGLAIGPDGYMYVVSQNTRSIVRYDLSNGLLLGHFVQPESGGLDSPWGIAFGPDGNIYVSCHGPSVFQGNCIRRYDGTTGEYIDQFVTTASGILNYPTEITFGPDGNLYVANSESHSVVRFDGITGAYIDDFVAASSGGLFTPYGISFGPDGHLYVADHISEGTVLRYDGTTGAFIDVFVQPLAGELRLPYGLAFGHDDNLYVTSVTNSEVIRFNGTTGEFMDGFAQGPYLSMARYLLFQPVECTTNTECDDSNNDTTDLCDAGQCRNMPFARLYVDANATAGANTGLDWANAFLDLQDAIDAARTTGGPVDVWVATGTYVSDRSTGDRFATFQLHDGLSLYGGFQGGETALEQRDVISNVVTLSGDLAGDDSYPFDNNNENAYHVVIASESGLTAPTILDGFTITGGNASAPTFKDPDYLGGGLLVEHGSPTITNCTFVNNSAFAGGAIYARNYCNMSLTNCTFLGNRTTGGGGGAISNSSHADTKLINCVFSGNTANNGGAFSNNQSRPTFTNCTIANNTAVVDAGGIRNYEQAVTVTNSILWGNVDAGGSDESAQFFGSDWNINYSCIQGWTGSLGGTGNIDDCSPTFINALGGDSEAGTYDDDLRISAQSNCIDTANNTADVDATVAGLQPIPSIDLAGMPRIIGGTVDQGAFEYAPCACLTDLDCRTSMGGTSGCADDNACNCAQCVSGSCSYSCSRFGNVTCDMGQFVDLDDILCVLSGFALASNCPNSDLAPCGGNGIINLDDILSVLNAFASSNPCGCEPAAAAPLCESLFP